MAEPAEDDGASAPEDGLKNLKFAITSHGGAHFRRLLKLRVNPFSHDRALDTKITSVVILVNPPGGSLAVPSPKNTPTSMALASCVKGGEWKEGGPGIVQQVQVPQPKIQAIDTHLKVGLCFQKGFRA